MSLQEAAVDRGPRRLRNWTFILAVSVLLLSQFQPTLAQQQQQPHLDSDPHRHSQRLPDPGSDPLVVQLNRQPPVHSGPISDWQAKRDFISQPVVSRNPLATYTHPIPHAKVKSDHPLIPDDASALATLAPAPSVRAPPPHPARVSVIRNAAVSSPQADSPRDLEDWEVEDFVLLATVDGDLYSSDRKTGKKRWHVEVEQPIVDTVHYPPDDADLRDDLSRYIWAVEPNSDGGLYIWNPASGAGIIRTGFTMKKLVEDLAPYRSEIPPVVYTGDKKSSLITLDAATGRVLGMFDPSRSHISDFHKEECSSSGTITLGRTEYLVGIQRHDGRRIATLKYSEWGPGNHDQDLIRQYELRPQSLDRRYITGRHDGSVYGFDFGRSEAGTVLFSNKFPSPVARVFDVCRLAGAEPGSSPSLIVLPQPSPPHDQSQERLGSVFLNQTDAGSWYALSSKKYPLIIDAPIAKLSLPTSHAASRPEQMEELIGKHFLEHLDIGAGSPRATALLPGPSISSELGGSEPIQMTAGLTPDQRTSTVFDKLKTLPKSASDSIVDFISNPVLMLLFLLALSFYQKELRRWYHGRKKTVSFLNEVGVDILDLSDSTEESTDSDPKLLDQAPNIASNGQPSDSPPSRPLVELSDQSSNPLVAVTDSSEGNQDHKPSLEILVGQDGERTKKKAHRGRRSGANRKNKKYPGAKQNDLTPAADDITSVEEVVRNAKTLGNQSNIPEPDIETVEHDMQSISGPVIRMGNIEVDTDIQLGIGSNGTIVFAGKFDGREVAVKRMLIQFYDIASQETKLLRESDDHPHVIRYFAQQVRAGFLYIALERCAASLADVVERPDGFRDLAESGARDIPTVLYQIANGLSHLHSLRIVHRDLKPQNILVNMTKEGKPRLVVSDFGLCKKLEGGQSSFGATTGRAAGTSGWRAPELLLDDDVRDGHTYPLPQPQDNNTSTHSGSLGSSELLADGSRRVTRSIDIFSLGLVFFYVLTKGMHPFDCGDRYMREVNIRKANYSLRPLDALGDVAYEAKDLVEAMIAADPRRRPSARDVMAHPFFWPPKRRLAFLCDVSDHMEKEPRGDEPYPATASAALAALERHAPAVTRGDFLRLLPRDFVDSLGRQRKYSGARLLDLLRALRNKRNHYEDMPDTLKRALGPLPHGYLTFWTGRFPQLLLVCWNVVYALEWDTSDRFREYYNPTGL